MINKFFTIFCTLLAAALLVGSVNASETVDKRHILHSEKTEQNFITVEWKPYPNRVAVEVENAFLKKDIIKSEVKAFEANLNSQIRNLESDSLRYEVIKSEVEAFNRGFEAKLNWNIRDLEPADTTVDRHIKV